MDTMTAGMVVTRAQQPVGKTVVETRTVSSARVGNASMHIRNATDPPSGRVRTGATRPRGAVVRNAHRDGSDARVDDASGRSTDAMDAMGAATMDPMRQIVTSKVNTPTYSTVELIVSMNLEFSRQL